MKKTYYAIQVELSDGSKLLCWENKKHFYFAQEGKRFLTPLPPKLFLTKKAAKEALDNIPLKNGNTNQFNEIIGYKKVNIIKVTVSYE